MISSQGLELAAAANHFEVCGVLLASGAYLGRAMHVAAHFGSLSSARRILDRLGEHGRGLVRASVSAVLNGFTPLCLALVNNHVELTKTLLYANADPHQELSVLALRRMEIRPVYTGGFTQHLAADTAKLSVLQLAQRLGVVRRPILKHMIDRLDEEDRLQNWAFSTEGTLCANADRPLIFVKDSDATQRPQPVSHGVRSCGQLVEEQVYPQEFWQLVKKIGMQEDPKAVIDEMVELVCSIQRALTQQARDRNKRKRVIKPKDDEDGSKLSLDMVVKLNEFQEEEDEGADDESAASSSASLLPWHVLADREGWDAVSVLGFCRKQLPKVLDQLLHEWRKLTQQENDYDIEQMKQAGAKEEDIQNKQKEQMGMQTLAREGTLGMHFWAKVLDDNELIGTFQLHKLYISKFEEEALKLFLELAPAKASDAERARAEANTQVQGLPAVIKEIEQRTTGALQEGAQYSAKKQAQEAYNFEVQNETMEVHRLEMRAAVMELTAALANTEWEKERDIANFLSGALGAATKDGEGSSGKSSFNYRMRAWMDGHITSEKSAEVGKGDLPRPSLDVKQFLAKLEAVCLPERQREMPVPKGYPAKKDGFSQDSAVLEPNMKALVARAKLFAVERWITDTVHQAARIELWQVFVLRLWSSDERIPQCFDQHKEDPNFAALKDLRTYVEYACTQLTAETSNQVLFAYLPAEKHTAAGHGHGYGHGTRSIADMRSGEEINLPPLTTLTADPTLVWGMCQYNRGGTVLKLHVRSAVPTWMVSICPEQREYVVKPPDSITAKVKTVRAGGAVHLLSRGLDFASRTFDSSSMLNFPIGVPDSALNFESILDMDRVTIVEAEEPPESSK